MLACETKLQFFISLFTLAENVQRRNHQTRKNFEETYNEFQCRQTELNKKKEMELIQRLKQAKQNNENLVRLIFENSFKIISYFVLR